MNYVCKRDVPKRFQVTKLFLQEQDPGDTFEMSEWFDYLNKKPPEDTIVLVKCLNRNIFKAVRLDSRLWCTWEEGYEWSGLDIKDWAYIRKIDGEDREDVTEWAKIRSEKGVSE